MTVVPKPHLSFLSLRMYTIFIDIYNVNEVKIIIIVYYRAPKISVENFWPDLNKIFSVIYLANNEVYNAGEFNIDLLQYYKLNSVADYYNFFHSHGLQAF